MAVTKPVRNQMAYWEKINDLGSVSAGTVNINIDTSTVHKMTLAGNIVISFSDISAIPDGSFVSLTLLFIGNGTYTVTLPASCKSTSGATLSALIPNTKLGIQLFTIDKGVSWKVAPFATDF